MKDSRKDILNAIDNTVRLASNSPKIQEHLEGFVRKGRGSYVNNLEDVKSTLNFLRDLAPAFIEISHKDVNAECPGAARGPARYFRTEISEESQAFESVCLVNDLDNTDLSNVRLRRGKHGIEFYIPNELAAGMCPSVTGKKPTNNIWIILGPSEAGEIVWTWYPGRMTAGTKLDNHAVKLNSDS